MFFGQKDGIVFFLIDPQIGILHEVLLLLSVLVLRHGPKIKVLILSRLRLFSFLFFRFALGGLGGGVSSGEHHLLVFKFGDLRS